MNLRPYLYFFILVFLVPLGTNAQLEASIWYFGDKAGLDFRSGTPVALDDGELSTYEGCATISDPLGNLLFYTDGVEVWNRNHQLMPNGTGLYGFSSSTQSAIIIPNPADPNIYYIFTCQISAGINYSVVDLSLDGGLGDVTIKNVRLLTNSTEKLTAVEHANGTDIWVIGHGWRNARYLAYRVTAAGVNVSPVTSDVGIDLSIGRSADDAIGYLKASPDGTKLAVCHRNLGAELLDFDSATGIVSNPILLSSQDNYGVEFSPSGEVLYMTVVFGGILQYDLNSADIPASALDISGSIWGSGGLQLAIDGKIYSTIYDRTSLSVINNPDVVGPGCNYEFGTIDLGNNVSYLGLPPFIQSYFYVSGIQANNLCLGDSTEFSIQSNEPIVSILWDFGDGNTSTVENPTHIYAAAGTYMVRADVTVASGTQTETREIVISEVPVANAISNIEQCHSESTYSMDLGTLDTQVLGTQSATTFSVAYFATQADADNNTNPLVSPMDFNYGTTTVYARLYNTNNPGCYDTTNFEIVVKRAPLSSTVADWVVCDDDGDGEHSFDFTVKDMEVLGGQSGTLFTVSYHLTQTDADNATNPIAANHVSNLPLEQIFYRMANRAYPECFLTGTFNVGVIDQVVANTPNDLEICDDNNDGSATFDLSMVESDVLGTQSPTSVTISYHESQDEADNGLNPLPLNHTSNSYQKSIYVRVANTLDSSCYATTFFQLNIFDTPELSNLDDWMVCDDDNDGEYVFDFIGKGNEILGSAVDVVISFHISEHDAELSQNEILGSYRNISNPQTIYYRLENTNNPNCFSVGNFDLQVFDTPTAYQPTDIVVCDDAETGSYVFDLSQKDSEVLNGQDLSIYEVSYYTNELNALNAEDSVTKNTYTNIAASETLYVRVQHSQLSSCYDVTSFNLIVNPLPQPDLEETYVICPDSPELVIDAGLFESYSWRDPQGTVTDDARTLDIVELGNYELTVWQTQFGITCSNTIGFEVVSSGAPDSFTVTNNGFSDEITLTIDAMGIGDFEYSLDGSNFQTANQFQVFPGEYSVFVRDPYGCRTLSKDIIALGYQRFFSPNGDGTNDTWNIIGGQLFPDSKLFIYDRYGKLLGQIAPHGQGWDGTFSGKPLPSADYWFRYDYDNGKTHTGHFSLIR